MVFATNSVIAVKNVSRTDHIATRNRETALEGRLFPELDFIYQQVFSSLTVGEIHILCCSKMIHAGVVTRHGRFNDS